MRVLLSAEELDVLQHSLGLDRHGRGEQSRNYFVTDFECSVGRLCASLVDRGLMRDAGPHRLMGGMHYLTVTDEGRKRVAAESPTPPKLTKGQQRYRRFLAADCGISFGEWLREGL